jgi:hypothetical protein
MGKAVAYLRVSTQQQHRSGLGIEAQRAAIARFAEGEGIKIIAEFVEAETGKGADALDRRPQSTNKGCIFELHELLDAVRLQHLLLVVDHTTDESFLTEILQQGWAHITTSSPNRTDPSPCVRLYRLHGAGSRGIDKLVATLAAPPQLGPESECMTVPGA